MYSVFSNKKLFMLLIITLLMFCFFLNSCASATATAETSETDVSDTTVSASSELSYNTFSATSEGNKLNISIGGNPTTGYSWFLDTDLETDGILVLTDQSYTPYKVDPGILGSGGTYHFVFTAQKAGTVDLVFYYKRYWEDLPVKNYKLTVSTDKFNNIYLINLNN